MTATTYLERDARNRALRTFLVALAVDVSLALALVLVNAFSDATSWGDVQWSVLGFLLLKTAVTSAGAYVLRRKLDRSTVPTPLPPIPPAMIGDGVWEDAP